MPVVLKKQIPFTVQIDGEDVRLYIKRMTVEEFVEFSAEFLARDKKQTPTESVVRTQSERIKRDVDEAREYAQWVCDVFDRFVAVHPGDLALENQAITKGSDFAKTLAGYDNIVALVLARVYTANRLSTTQKKTSSSPHASATGSTPAPSPEASGPALETTAASAETKDSVANAPAPENPSSASSGETAPSSSAPALSAS